MHCATRPDQVVWVESRRLLLLSSTLGGGVVAVSVLALILLALVETASGVQSTVAQSYRIAYAIAALRVLVVGLVTWAVTKSLIRMLVVAAAVVWTVVLGVGLRLLRAGAAWSMLHEPAIACLSRRRLDLQSGSCVPAISA